ncbi:MAG TPA: DinB family protein [Dehalococcoidia bacterium]|nr:DinB family protein [Dehalococcoidia bacterium]
MVVRLDAGREAVRAYVAEQALLGKEHVISLVRTEGDAIAASITDLTDEQGSAEPAPGEFSALQVLQHLNGSFERSIDRLKTLSASQPWTNRGAPAGSGSIPGDATSSFVEARRQFLEGTEAVLAVLEAADEARGLDVTATHAGFGDFNWLEWATYSHHVHTHDHVGQLAEIRAAVRK